MKKQTLKNMIFILKPPLQYCPTTVHVQLLCSQNNFEKLVNSTDASHSIKGLR